MLLNEPGDLLAGLRRGHRDMAFLLLRTEAATSENPDGLCPSKIIRLNQHVGRNTKTFLKVSDHLDRKRALSAKNLGHPSS